MKNVMNLISQRQRQSIRLLFNFILDFKRSCKLKTYFFIQTLLIEIFN